MRNGLQKCVDKFFNKENVLCKNCNNKVICEINPNAHLLIDVEHAYYSALLVEIRFPNSPKHTSLSEVPMHLHVKNEKYQLIGLISYKGSAEQQTLGHYITYCHRMTRGYMEKNMTIFEINI